MFESLLPGSILQVFLYGLVIWLAIYFYFKQKNKLPPGPFRLPLLGNALQLGEDKRYYIKFYEWSKKYGPVITVGLGPVTIVVVNTIETAMEVLVKKSTDFSGRQESPSSNSLNEPGSGKTSLIAFEAARFQDHAVPRYSLAIIHVTLKWLLQTMRKLLENNMVPVKYITNGYKDIALAQYGPMWKLHRRISTKALRHYMQGQALEERIHTALQTAFPVLEASKEPFDPNEVITFFITNILMSLCFHGEYEYGNAELKSIIEQADKLNDLFNNFIPEDLFPQLEYVYKSKAMKDIEDHSDSLIRNFTGRKFREQKQTFDKGNLRHLTDMLLLAREETEAEEGESSEDLTDEHLVQTLSNIFFAGVDSSRLTLKFAILHMIAFPDIQKKVQEEIDREIGKDRLPGIEDRPNLGYTEAVLHESMRLATVSPAGLFHRTMVDTEIAGYKIPKKTLVMINHWALHNDPNAWDQVDRFVPERYLDENGRLGPKPPNWLPFSAGKRVCMGEFVAKPELHLLFAGLMQRYSWKAETGVKVKIEPEGNCFLGIPPPFKVLVERRM